MHELPKKDPSRNVNEYPIYEINGTPETLNEGLFQNVWANNLEEAQAEMIKQNKAYRKFTFYYAKIANESFDYNYNPIGKVDLTSISKTPKEDSNVIICDYNKIPYPTKKSFLGKYPVYKFDCNEEGVPKNPLRPTDFTQKSFWLLSGAKKWLKHQRTHHLFIEPGKDVKDINAIKAGITVDPENPFQAELQVDARKKNIIGYCFNNKKLQNSVSGGKRHNRTRKQSRKQKSKTKKSRH